MMIKLKKISIFMLPRANRMLAGENGQEKLPGFLAALRVSERLLSACYKSTVRPPYPHAEIQPELVEEVMARAARVGPKIERLCQANPLFKYLNVGWAEHKELVEQFEKAARVEVVIDYPHVGRDFWVDLYFLESGEKRAYHSGRFRAYVDLFTGRVTM